MYLSIDIYHVSCRVKPVCNIQVINCAILSLTIIIISFDIFIKELLKHTPQEHPDHDQLQIAAQVMKDVASSINENKRKFENLNGIAEWQLNVDSWQVRSILSLAHLLLPTSSSKTRHKFYSLKDK